MVDWSLEPDANITKLYTFQESTLYGQARPYVETSAHVPESRFDAMASYQLLGRYIYGTPRSKLISWLIWRLLLSSIMVRGHQRVALQVIAIRFGKLCQ